ncbi:hypothetical protein Vafri_17918 [Volvox africanus]|uniref:Uncharacterized protein n=1 Tax=Volvox africanus TaxID=51714 RepID=A0A8J4BLJ1_9CHLO|nr:hypothetical protein Vafri_17918 [Volvox africanus]
MEMRHAFCQTWRRTSSAPPGVRTCTPASAVTPAQRRLRPRQRSIKQGLPSSCAVAVDSIYQRAATTAEPVFIGEAPSQGACSLDAACPAVLQTRLSKAHSSAASAALIVQDMPGEKLVATASLDKGMAIWRFYSTQGDFEDTDGSYEESIEVTRLKVPGAPVFSLAKIPEVLPDGTILRKRPKPPGIYLGTASKEILTWMLGSKDVGDKVVLDGHTGWVRSLAVTGKWLFSCGCNHLRLWDTTFRTPKECDAVRLFTGDILAIAASDGRVFTAGADGSLRSWIITRAGDLQEGPSRERAHDGRVSACTIAGGRVFTVSYDGSIKAWNAETLELVAAVKDAHNGDKIFCVAVGSNGVVFTGGDDKLVRAWHQDLSPIGAPLEGHGASVRVLSAGHRALLVSGDADGDVCIWETYPVELPSPARSPCQSSVLDPLITDDAIGAYDSAAALTPDGQVPANAVGEAVVFEAAVEQLESMLVMPQPGPPLQLDDLDATQSSREPGAPEPQALSLHHHHEHQQLYQSEVAASQCTEQQSPEAMTPLGIEEQMQFYVNEHDPASNLLLPSDTISEPAVLGALADALHPDAGTWCRANVEHIVDSVGISHGDASSQLVVVGPGSVASPVINANGSSVFAVLAATVSGEAPEEISATVESSVPEVVNPSPSVRQIEVESVASAVAAACITTADHPAVATAAGGRTP